MHSANDGGLRFGRWVFGASAVLGVTLLAGRLSGLIREIELAATFGVSSAADAAVVILTLPDLLVNVLLSGGLSAALIPRLRELESGAAHLLFRQTATAVVGTFGAFAACLALAPGAWFSLLAPGLPAQAMPPMAAILLAAVAIPLTAVSGVTTAALNSMQRFLIAGCGTLIFNLAVIASLLGGRSGLAEPLVSLGVGIAAGAAIRLVSQLVGLPRGLLFGPVWCSPPDAAFLRAFAATGAAASLMLLVPVIVRSLASTIAPGAIAALNYAFKLVELPAGVLIVSISSVALVRLSQHHGANDPVAAAQVLRDSVRRSALNAIGAGLIVAYFADSIIHLILGRGAMGYDDLGRVTVLTRLALIGLPFLALGGVAMADLNARQRALDVLKATVGCLLLLPLLAYPGVRLNSEILLGLAVVAFQIAHAVWLSRIGQLRTFGAGGWLDARMLIATVVGVLVVGATVLLDRQLALQHHAIRLGLACAATLAVVVLPQRVLGIQRGGVGTQQ
jgi:putative peptidoglycan lipid II flippase